MKSIKMVAVVALVATSGAAMAYKAGTTRDQTIAAVAKKFKQMNTDGKGDVTAAELDAFMSKSSAKRGEAHDAAKVARRLKRLDADSNGSVSQAELQVEEMEKFDRADADRNGKIEGAEAA